MTEAEWIACADPTPMLEWLWGKASDRKLSLYLCACFRKVWEALCDKRSRMVVDLVERHADGEDAAEQLHAAVRSIYGTTPIFHAELDSDEQAHTALLTGGVRGAGAVATVALAQNDVPTADAAITLVAIMSKGYDVIATGAAARTANASLLRCICGNPCRPSSPLPPAVLVCNHGTIPRLAQAIYDDRKLPEGTLDAARLAILADALLDAGCEDEALIQHCRSAGPHVRGCWAIDLILGKG